MLSVDIYYSHGIVMTQVARRVAMCAHPTGPKNITIRSHSPISTAHCAQQSTYLFLFSRVVLSSWKYIFFIGWLLFRLISCVDTLRDRPWWVNTMPHQCQYYQGISGGGGGWRTCINVWYMIVTVVLESWGKQSLYTQMSSAYLPFPLTHVACSLRALSSSRHFGF